MNKQIPLIFTLTFSLCFAQVSFAGSLFDKIKKSAEENYKKIEDATKKIEDATKKSVEGLNNDSKSSDNQSTAGAKQTHDPNVLNDKESFVRNAQIQLKLIGLYSGSEDGIYGPRTRNAILQYEEIKGLAQTGNVTRDIIVKIANSGNAGEYYGDKASAAGASGATVPTTPATTAPATIGQGSTYARQSAFRDSAQKLGTFDLSIEICQGTREGYRSRFDSLVSIAHPEYRSEAMSLYDNQYAQWKQLENAFQGGSTPLGSCSQLEDFKATANGMLERLGETPSATTQTPASSTAVVTAAASASQLSSESHQRMVAALQMCPGTKAEVNGERLLWEFDPPDKAIGIAGNYASYEGLKNMALMDRKISLNVGEINRIWTDGTYKALLRLTFQCLNNCIAGEREMSGKIFDKPRSVAGIPLCNTKQEFRTDVEIARQLLNDIEVWVKSSGSSARVVNFP